MIVDTALLPSYGCSGGFERNKQRPSLTVILRCEQSEPRRMNAPALAAGPSPFEACAALRRLRVTVTDRIARDFDFSR